MRVKTLQEQRQQMAAMLVKQLERAIRKHGGDLVAVAKETGVSRAWVNALVRRHEHLGELVATAREKAGRKGAARPQFRS